MRRFLTLTALLLLAVAPSGCTHQASGDEDEGGANAIAEVTLTQVQRADIGDTLHLTGTIAAPPNQDVRVSSFVAGRIAEMKVAEGDRSEERRVGKEMRSGRAACHTMKE